MQKRPEETKGTTRLIRTGCGNLYVTINTDGNGRPYELFTSIGKAGGCASSQAEAIGRLVSIGLQSGADPRRISRQLKGIECNHPGEDIKSCSDAIAKAIEQYLENSALLCPVNGNRQEPSEKPVSS